MPISTCYRLIACVLVLIQSSLVYSQNQPKPPGLDTLKLIAEEEQRRLTDPATGTVPYERLDEARRQVNSRSSTPNGARVAQSGIPNITWQERGPSNIGGRTRALLFDPNDPTHKKVWAGSPAGGLWYTNDITDPNAVWTPVSDNWENTIVTALAADPSNPQVMYAGTGDTYNYVAGGGVWKTINGGTTWSRLSSTIPGGNSPTVSSSFGYIQRIVVNSSGQVFAATQYGVVRSTDGGRTWTYALAPNQGIGAGTNTNNYYSDLVTDLELATDGILYATFNPSRVFKSTSSSGTAWVEITPTGITGERTELALAPSTSGAGQVIYCVSRAYNTANSAQDVKWFKKSNNGGITWIDLPIPTFSWGSHFTTGNGSNALNLLVHPTDANTVYAGGYDWFRSTNGGISWGNPFTTNYQYQYGLWFQPNSGTNVALVTDTGILWSIDWGSNVIAAPTLNSRNNGYRACEVSSVSMRSSPGSSYLLAGIRSIGYIQMTSPGISTGNQIFGAYPGITFIDEDDPTLQIIQLYNSFYRYNSSGSTQLSSVNTYYSPIPADYDSQSNTLYVADNTNGQAIIWKTTNVGTTSVTTTLTLTGITNLASYLKLSPDRTKILIGTGSGQLYRISNLGQSTPLVTAIDNGALPQYTYVSCIDVGVDDNELLVTLSNYGVQSVWYTNNGGTTWTGKDQTNYGLPDVPVRSALFNPRNRKQILLGTDAGVWSTDDITVANPGWAFSSSGMGAFQVNQLRYRASDGRITAATNGRSIWTTDVFIASSIAITTISNATLCAGNTFTVSFSTVGSAFDTGTSFGVWLSDANGNFTNAKKIGSGTTNLISAALPSSYNALPYGTNYQVKIIAINPTVESNASNPLAIGNLLGANVYDRRADLSSAWGSGTICIGSKTTLKIGDPYAFDHLVNPALPIETYQWQYNGVAISGANSNTVLAQQAGNYTVVLKQAGCSPTSSAYTLSTSTDLSNSISSISDGPPQCDDHPLKLFSYYIGETATYQWKRDGTDISGATSYTYNALQTGNYSYSMLDGSCTFTSPSAYFQFGRSLNSRLSLNWSSDTLICPTYPYARAIINNSTYPYDYTIQLYKDGVILDEAISSSSYSLSQPGLYSISLKQGSCETRSNPLVLTMANQIKPRIILNYSQNKLLCPGETCLMTASPVDLASIQWQRDGVDIPGAFNVAYTASLSGNYTVRITLGSCSGVSDPVSLTFSNAIQPKINYLTAEACSDIDLNANDLYRLSGYQYQWHKNGVLIDGATNATLNTTQSGAYSVSVTNGSCTGLSKEVYANVGNGVTAKPVISYFPNLPSARQLCPNNSLYLYISWYYNGVQWKRNGVPIPGATRTRLYATESGLYTVVSQDGSCTAESDPVEIKIGEATTATLNGNALISTGQSALLPVSFTGPAPWSFTLTNGQSVTATYQNPAFIVVSPTSNSTYQLASVGNACGTGTVSGQASVSVGTGSADVSLNMAVNNRTPNVGDVVSYTLSTSNAGPTDAVGVQLSSLLPAGFAFVSSPSSGVSVANGVVSANLGTIPANSTNTISFQATPTKAGIFATAAQITSSQTPDPDSQPNSGTGDGQDDEATVDIRTLNDGLFVASANPNQVPLPTVSGNQPAADPAKADLSLTIQVDKLTPVVAQNDIVTTTLTINNRGGSSASSVIVQVVLPNGSFSAQSPMGWIQVDSQTYKRYINLLATGQSTTVSLKWQPTGSGTLKAQILDLAEPDSDSTPGNGYDNGEDDEARIFLRTR